MIGHWVGAGLSCPRRQRRTSTVIARPPTPALLDCALVGTRVVVSAAYVSILPNERHISSHWQPFQDENAIVICSNIDIFTVHSQATPCSCIVELNLMRVAWIRDIYTAN